MRNSILIKVTWSLLMATMTYLSACSQPTTGIQAESTDNCQSPYFIVLSEEGETEQLPLKSTSVDVNIAGVIADVNIKQSYTNKGKTPIEAIYVFPASTRAAVYSMVMTINEREIIAIVEEKQKARTMYDEAKDKGQSASLLEQHRPNVFQMNVANIMPGNTIEVSLSYTELLIPNSNIYEFVYPTVVGPRYVSKDETESNMAENWTGNPYLEENEQATSTLDINLNLSAGLPIKDIRCETHKNTINYSDKTNASLKLEEANGGNRDFVVQYRLAGNKIETGLLLYENQKGENYFLAMVQPPKTFDPETVPNREYVFIVDISGSMSGFPLDVSKTLMKNILGKLKKTDKFNIVFFAGGSEVYASQSVFATSSNIEKAIDYMDNRHGGGGTELLSALKKAMSLNADDNFSRSFVILTDGYVSVEKQTFDYIRNNLGNANFFSLGIGSSVNRYIIEGMAHVGQGESYIALNKQEAEKQAIKFVNTVSRPILTNISYSFGNNEVYDLLPESVPDLFSEKPLIIAGKYKGELNGSLVVKGINGSGNITLELNLNNAYKKNNKALEYIWAREKIRLLSDYNHIGNDEKLKTQICELGIQYNLLTEFTSFIAIDSEITNLAGNHNTVTQPLPLPSGVSNTAVGGNYKFNSKRAVGAPPVPHSVSDMELIVLSEAEEVENESLVFCMVENMPQFQGGDLAKFQQYIQSNIKYPKEAQEQGIFGKVFVQFNIDEKGKLIDIKIVRGVDPLLDNEVIKALKSSPDWTPGKQRGRPVTVSFTMPVYFMLDS